MSHAVVQVSRYIIYRKSAAWARADRARAVRLGRARGRRVRVYRVYRVSSREGKVLLDNDANAALVRLLTRWDVMYVSVWVADVTQAAARVLE